MSLIEDIPEEYLKPGKKDQFIAWLRINIEAPHTRKYMLLDWCDYVGIPISFELAQQANIPRQI